MTAPRWSQVPSQVVRQRSVGAEHRVLELDVPATFGVPAPGQFVQLLLPSTASAALLPRPMSVAGARRRGRRLVLEFLYAPVGAGTHALAALAEGAPLEVLGPLGRGFPLDASGTPVLVAGGRGVAPLLYLADELARRGRRAEFLFGARSRTHLVGLDDARRRVERLGGRLHACTNDGSRGFRGNVVQLLDRLHARLAAPLVVHACGPHAMLEALAHWCERRRVPAHVAMESIMACGTGVCRGCPLPRSAAGRTAFGNRAPSLEGNRDYAMCCTEGPVFASTALDWERIA